jgi:glycosyltransferase involved in cell wall biosynthesis
MKLLAIPNDSSIAYKRNYEEDFLSEFNPRDPSGNRAFDEVAFLNWKDDKVEENFGIKSIPFVDDKTEARKIMSELSLGKREFISPLFYEIFNKELALLDTSIRSLNPDVIRSFNTHFAAELGNLVSTAYDIPLVVSAHDPSRLTSAIKYADSLVCISNDLAEKSLSYGVSPEKITIIPDGIDMNSFYPMNGNRVGVSADYKILSVGRIVESKNIETLLESVAILNNEMDGKIRHLHLGNGTPEAYYNINKRKDSLGLKDISHFLGGVQKELLPSYYSWADVYTLPTLWEGLGRAQIEALACGTPAITSNEPPMNEVVEHGYNGLVANPRSARDFADKIKTYFKDKDLKAYMEQNARSSVVNKYSMDTVMHLHSKNYKKITK